MEDEDRLAELEKKLEKVEAELLEQEHRPFRLLWNFWNRKTIWKDPDDHRRAATKKALLWRLFFSPTTIALGSGGLVAILTLYFLSQQNRLFDRQNDLFSVQNKRIDQQTKLLEASRRSSQMFIMSEVLGDLNEETKVAADSLIPLSKGLIGRITSLSRAMKPYFYLKGNDMSTRDVSPERGQLLLAILTAQISRGSLGEIFSNGDFSYAELLRVELETVALWNLKLDSADFTGSLISNSYFYNCSLAGARLVSTRIFNCSFTNNMAEDVYGYMYLTDFSNSDIRGSKFQSFAGSDSLKFNYSWLSKSEFMGAFDRSSFQSTKLLDVSLQYCSFDNSDFTNAFLRISKESQGFSFTNCIMDSVRVNRQDWFDYIEDSLYAGNVDRLRDSYRIESTNDNQVYPRGFPYVLVRKSPSRSSLITNN